MVKIKYFCTSHVGKCRKANQDNLFCNGAYLPSDNEGTGGIVTGSVNSDTGPVFAIFDGMGGEECGEMAAYLAAREMDGFSFKGDAGQDLLEFCRKANHSICLYARENKISSMGTTAAILRFTDNHAELCNVGDSKIFLCSGKAFNQLSFDHVGISVGGRKPPLTQNLGIEETEMVIEPYLAMGDYQPGDVFLICSDGLTDMVTEDRIKQLLCKKRKAVAAKKLLREALANGGKDNVSFVLISAKKNKFKRLREVRLWRRK